MPFDAFAVAAPGLEPIVQGELKSLRAPRIRVVEGGVEFRASHELLYAANLHLRAASRVIVRLASFPAPTFPELERRASRISWETIVPPLGRVQVRVTCRKSRLYHSDAVAERVVDAIQQRTNASLEQKTHHGASSLDEEGEAEQLLVVRLERDECTVSADSSGAHLHQRGYRRAVTQAPLRETLAAAMVLASGWDEMSPLVDPFCGSGTIPIEAALIARRLAPGRDRRFRFMAWPSFDESVWRDVLSRAREAERPASGGRILGADRSGWAMRAAVGNAERAGVAGDVTFERHDAIELPAPPEHGPPTGWIVTNPPYGVRLGERDQLRLTYARFGSVLRDRFPRWHVGVLSTDRRLDSQMRVPLLDRFRTSNGGIGVHFLLGLVPETDRRRERRST